jgi:hypothetical protein
MNDPLRPAAMRSLERLRSTLASRPAHDQHGDFVVDNPGLRCDHRLAIFDWEDYGAVELTGLDLFTLEISMSDALRDLAENPGAPSLAADPAGLDLDRMCAALHLPRQLYDELRLGYAFVFRFLKRNYGIEIRERLAGLLDRLIPARLAVA